MQRNRLAYAAIVAIVIGVGLASRSPLAGHLPEFISSYAGDTLWALMVFLGVGFIFPKSRIPAIAIAALAISFTVEISQLAHGNWISQIRATRLGALVLGAGFLWSDLVCYTVGVLIGVAGEALWPRLSAVRRPHGAT